MPDSKIEIKSFPYQMKAS